MHNQDYFWRATAKELKRGFFHDKKAKTYTCLVCNRTFEQGAAYSIGEKLYTAKKAAHVHVAEEHDRMFEYFLNMGKVYTGLTAHQREIMRMFYQGCTDKEIQEKTGATNTSTIRNQRFAFKEKYKQAKIIVAMWELLEERREEIKLSGKAPAKSQQEEFVEFHRTAVRIDERYAITQAEKDEVLGRYFDKDNRLVIDNFPVKEKKKIIILQHIMKEFDAERRYTEKEVNAIIGDFYEDIPSIRRYMIEYGFLDRERDGSVYWVKR